MNKKYQLWKKHYKSIRKPVFYLSVEDKMTIESKFALEHKDYLNLKLEYQQISKKVRDLKLRISSLNTTLDNISSYSNKISQFIKEKE